jgi:hypothetical protein
MALTKAGNIVLRYPHRKNLIINGNFDIWQRGTSFVGASAVTASADRWRRTSSNDSVVTISAGTHNAILGSRFTKYALGVSVTTADTSIGAAQYEAQVYIIEGYDVQTIMGQTVTLSFWVYSSLPGTYCVAFRSVSPTYRSYIAEYTINQANTPEYKTITFTMDNGSVGTWDYENGTGLTMFFMLACGTSLQGTANSWQTANVIATSNQVNFLSATSRSFYLYQVQLELGPVATPFENRPFGEELALCQRYYEKSYSLGVFPGTNTLTGELAYIAPITGTVYQNIIFKVSKRIPPTGTVYIYSATGAINNVRDITSGADVAASGVVESNHSAVAQFTATAGRLYGFQWVADAEFT